MWRTAEKRFVRHVCLRNPFLPLLLGIPSIHSLPKASGSWERQHALHYGCIVLVPSLQLQEKICFMQRIRGFGHGVVVCKIFYNAVIVLSVVLCDCYKPMNNCRDWAFSHSGMEAGLPAFQLPTFAKCDALPKRDLRLVCLRNPFLPFLFRIPSIHSLPEAGFQSCSTFHQLCISAASCPSLRCSCRKNPSHAERQRNWSRSCGLQDFVQCSDCALSCALRMLQTNEQLLRFSFLQQWVGSGTASLSAARSWKMWLTPERRFMRHVCLRNPFLPLLWEFQASTPCQKQVPESGSTFQPLCYMLASCSSLHCSYRKKPVSCREAEELVTELWSPRFFTMQWLCSQLCYVTAANQWTIVEI